MPGNDENVSVVGAVAGAAMQGVSREVAGSVTRIVTRRIDQITGKSYKSDDQARMKRWKALYQKYLGRSLNDQYTINDQNQPITKRKDINWEAQQQERFNQQVGDFHQYSNIISEKIASYITHRKAKRMYNTGDFTEQWLAELYDWSLNELAGWHASSDIASKIAARIKYCEEMYRAHNFISRGVRADKNSNRNKHKVLNSIRQSLEEAKEFCDKEVAKQSAHRKLGELCITYQVILSQFAHFCYFFRSSVAESTLNFENTNQLRKAKNPIHRKLGEFIDYCGPASFGKGGASDDEDATGFDRDTPKQPHSELQSFNAQITQRRGDSIPMDILSRKTEDGSKQLEKLEILRFFEEFFVCFEKIGRMSQSVKLANFLTGQKGDFWAYVDKSGHKAFQLFLEFAIKQLVAAQSLFKNTKALSDFETYHQDKKPEAAEFSIAQRCFNHIKNCENRVEMACEGISKLQDASRTYAPNRVERFNEAERDFLKHIVYFGEQQPGAAPEEDINTLRRLIDQPEQTSLIIDEPTPNFLQTAREPAKMPDTPNRTNPNSLHRESAPLQGFSESPDEMDEKEYEYYYGDTGDHEHSDDDQDDEYTPFLAASSRTEAEAPEAVELEDLVANGAAVNPRASMMLIPPPHAQPLTTIDMVIFPKQGIPVEETIVKAINITLDRMQPLPPLDFLYQEMLLRAIKSGDLQTLQQFVGERQFGNEKEVEKHNGFDLITAALAHVANNNPIFRFSNKGKQAHELYAAYAHYWLVTKRRALLTDFMDLQAHIDTAGSFNAGLTQFKQCKYGNQSVPQGSLMTYIKVTQQDEYSGNEESGLLVHEMAFFTAWSNSIHVEDCLNDLSLTYAADPDVAHNTVSNALIAEGASHENIYNSQNWDTLSRVLANREHACAFPLQNNLFMIRAQRLVRWRQQIDTMRQKLSSNDPDNPYDCSDMLLSALPQQKTLLQHAMQQLVNDIEDDDVKNSPIWPVIVWLHAKHPTQLFAGGNSSPVMVGLQSENVEVNKAVLELVLAAVSAILNSKNKEAAVDLEEIKKAWQLLEEVKVHFDRYGHSLFTQGAFRKAWGRLLCHGVSNVHSFDERERTHRVEFVQLVDAYQMAATVNSPVHLKGQAEHFQTVNKRSYLRKGKPFSHALKAWCTEVRRGINPSKLQEEHEKFIRKSQEDMQEIKNAHKSLSDAFVLKSKRDTQEAAGVKKELQEGARKTDAVNQEIVSLKAANAEMAEKLEQQKLQYEQRTHEQNETIKNLQGQIEQIAVMMKEISRHPGIASGQGEPDSKQQPTTPGVNHGDGPMLFRGPESTRRNSNRR